MKALKWVLFSFLFMGVFSLSENVKADVIEVYSGGFPLSKVYTIPQRANESLEVTISTAADFYYYTLNNGVEVTSTTGNKFTIPNSSLTAGTDTLTLRATRKSGNRQVNLTSEITILINQIYFVDTTPPAINPTKSPSTPIKSGVTIATNVTDTGTISSLKFAVGDQPLSYFATSGTTVGATKSFYVTQNGFYTIYAKDNSGNEARSVLQITNIDNVLPVLTLTDTLNEEPDNVAEINVSASDANGISVKKWALGVKDASYFSTKGNTFTGSAVSLIGNGEYTFYAQDTAGNTVLKSLVISRLSTDAIPEPELTHDILLKKYSYSVGEPITISWDNPADTGDGSVYTYSLDILDMNGYIEDSYYNAKTPLTFSISRSGYYYIEKIVLKDGKVINTSTSYGFDVYADTDEYGIKKSPISILIPEETINLDPYEGKNVQFTTPVDFLSQRDISYKVVLCLPGTGTTCLPSSSVYAPNIFYANEYVPFYVSVSHLGMGSTFFNATATSQTTSLALAENGTYLSIKASAKYHVYNPNLKVSASEGVYTASWSQTDLPDITSYRLETIGGTSLCTGYISSCSIASRYASSELKLFVIKNGQKMQVQHYVPSIPDMFTHFGDIDFGQTNHTPGKSTILSSTLANNTLEFVQGASVKKKYQITMQLTPFYGASGNSIDASNFNISSGTLTTSVGSRTVGPFSFSNNAPTTLLDVAGTGSDPNGVNRLAVNKADFKLTIPPNFVPFQNEPLRSSITYSVVTFP